MTPRYTVTSRYSRREITLACTSVLLVAVSGCHRWSMPSLPPKLLPPPPIEIPVANPAHIGTVDPDFLWRQIVDSVDDDFRIASEQPVRRDNTVWLEGRLRSYPEISSTTLEPWRSDTARGFERLQSTFQTIRRTVTVRAIPEETGYFIDVQVIKEQEDVDQSQMATAGSSSQRHDGTIVRNENQQRSLPLTLGWFEIGRDTDLERRIMAKILGRVSNVEKPRQRLLQP